MRRWLWIDPVCQTHWIGDRTWDEKIDVEMSWVDWPPDPPWTIEDVAVVFDIPVDTDPEDWKESVLDLVVEFCGASIDDNQELLDILNEGTYTLKERKND